MERTGQGGGKFHTVSKRFAVIRCAADTGLGTMAPFYLRTFRHLPGLFGVSAFFWVGRTRAMKTTASATMPQTREARPVTAADRIELILLTAAHQMARHPGAISIDDAIELLKDRFKHHSEKAHESSAAIRSQHSQRTSALRDVAATRR